MRKYTQRLIFEREVTITARDASEANRKIDDLISSTEFHGDVRCTDYEVFEDEPIQCPECKGDGCVVVDDEEKTCPKCVGECTIPFQSI